MTNKTAATAIGKWEEIVSDSNWEKGRVVVRWQRATGKDDEAFAREVGGITATHVGRLRQVHRKFYRRKKNYPGLRWAHFYAAITWRRSAYWLRTAHTNGWSVSEMRKERFQDPEASEPR